MHDYNTCSLLKSLKSKKETIWWNLWHKLSRHLPVSVFFNIKYDYYGYPYFTKIIKCSSIQTHRPRKRGFPKFTSKLYICTTIGHFRYQFHSASVTLETFGHFEDRPQNTGEYILGSSRTGPQSNHSMKFVWIV